jgi:glycosyltransferase involved in cell wall biosynthesis
MRALIVTPTLPVAGRSVGEGVMHRLRLFMTAIGRAADAVHIAHICPAEIASMPLGEVTRRQSEHWGREVTVSLIPRAARQTAFRSYYLDGILDAGLQPEFRPFASAAPAAAVAALVETGPDLLFLHRMPAAAAFLRTGLRHDRAYFDLDDVEHSVKWRRALAPPFWPGKVFDALQVPSLLLEERRAVRAARMTFVCSARDERMLRRIAGSGQVAQVPNALPMPAAAPAVTPEPTLGFLGSMHHPPNIEAAQRMALRIMPLIRREVPQARLLVAGIHSDTLDIGGAEGVERLGFVDDVGGFHARTRIACAPLVNGGGTRLKLIEAAGHARPMVSTRVGAEGLEFVPEREILLRDADAAFAAACVELLRDDAACARLGAAARARAVASYGADAASDRIARLMELPAA